MPDGSVGSAGSYAWIGLLDEFRVIEGLRSTEWVRAEFLNQRCSRVGSVNDPCVVVSAGPLEVLRSPPSWLDSYSNRRLLTVTPTVSTPLTDFPL